MDSKIGRVALGVVAVAAAVVLLVVLSSNDDTGSDEGTGGAASASRPAEDEKGSGGDKGDAGKPAVPTIVVRGGEPVGGIEELSYDAGEQIHFAVRSDTADELHIHGYDIERELPAGRTVVIQFPADIEGIFEAELHESDTQIAELRIEP